MTNSSALSNGALSTTIRTANKIATVGTAKVIDATVDTFTGIVQNTAVNFYNDARTQNEAVSSLKTTQSTSYRGDGLH
jgi:hypothetical protein